MTQNILFAAISDLAEISQALSDVDLAQPFSWRKHEEGVRLGLIGTYHELRDLAVVLTDQRQQHGPPLRLTQRVLGQVHLAYRELQATLLGVTEEQFDREPAPGEWSLRIILGHIIQAERAFFTLIHNGLAQQAAGKARPFSLPENEIDRITGSSDAFFDMTDNHSLSAVQANYETFHQRVLNNLVSLTDEQLVGPSPVWWEGEEYSLQYRLHRFDAHLRQHHVQVEKTMVLLKEPPNEARRLLRLIFRALAEVENAVLGAPTLGLAQRESMATEITQRTAALQKVVADCRQLETAAAENNIQAIQQITANRPQLANALGQNGLSLLMNAIYQRNTAVVETLLAAGATPDIFAAAALGDLDRLQAQAEIWSGYLNLYAQDGFTPLQLACYFNQEEAARWLIEQGAEVNAVAKNKMKIVPLHAAATHGNLAIIEALLQKGAEANAAQEGGYTAIHQAAHRNNVALAKLLLKFGADPHQPDSQGQTAVQLAEAEGHDAVLAVLES